MTKYLLLLCCILPVLLHGQTDTTQYPFVAYWAKGDTYNFEVSKIKLTYQNDSLVKADTTSYQSTFEVMDSTADSYLISYTFGDNFRSTEAISPEITDALSTFDLSSITYTTNELGQFKALKNWKTFAQAMQLTFDTLIARTIAEQQVDPAKFREIMAPMVAAYTTEQGILNKLVGELQHLHLLYGYNFVRGDTLEYEDSFANMFGGEPFPIKSKLYVEDAAWIDDYVVMRHFNTLAPAGEEVFRETMKRAYPVLVEKDPKGLDGMSFDIMDDNWYSFYYNPGIPIRIENDRWVTIVVEGETTVNQERLIIDWID